MLEHQKQVARRKELAVKIEIPHRNIGKLEDDVIAFNHMTLLELIL
jgi:hypothetical protein